MTRRTYRTRYGLELTTDFEHEDEIGVAEPVFLFEELTGDDARRARFVAWLDSKPISAHWLKFLANEFADELSKEVTS